MCETSFTIIQEVAETPGADQTNAGKPKLTNKKKKNNLYNQLWEVDPQQSHHPKPDGTMPPPTAADGGLSGLPGTSLSKGFPILRLTWIES